MCSMSATAAVLPMGIASARDHVEADSILVRPVLLHRCLAVRPRPRAGQEPRPRARQDQLRIRLVVPASRACRPRLRETRSTSMSRTIPASRSRVKLRQHLTGERRPIEAHNQHLHWPDHVITRARSS